MKGMEEVKRDEYGKPCWPVCCCCCSCCAPSPIMRMMLCAWPADGNTDVQSFSLSILQLPSSSSIYIKPSSSSSSFFLLQTVCCPYHICLDSIKGTHSTNAVLCNLTMAYSLHTLYLQSDVDQSCAAICPHSAVLLFARTSRAIHSLYTLQKASISWPSSIFAQ